MVFTTNGLAENVGILGTNSHDDTATHNLSNTTALLMINDESLPRYRYT